MPYDQNDVPLIDTSKDVVVVEAEERVVSFTYAGGTLGGQSVWACDLCGALVQEGGQALHTTSPH